MASLNCHWIFFGRCHLQVLTLEQLEEGFRGKRGSKESLLVDVAAKNLLKTLVATFCRASCCFFPTSPDEFSTWASRCCLPADPASCELWWPHDGTSSSLSLRIVLYHNIILYFCIRNIICTDRAKVRCSALNLIRFNTHQLNLSMCPLGAACMWVMNMEWWWLLDPEKKRREVWVVKVHVNFIRFRFA